MRRLSGRGDFYNAEGTWMVSPYANRVEEYGKRWYRPWIALLPILVVLGFAFWITRTKRGIVVREETSESAIAAIRQASRAVVFLDAVYSVDAALGRLRLLDSVKWMSAKYGFPDVDVFILDESSPVSKELLDTLDLKEVQIAMGAGSLIWLEKGRVVAEEFSARELEAKGILQRTQDLWKR